MIHLEKLGDLQAVKQFIQQDELIFLYVYADNCSVYHSLLPQVEQVLTQFPKIKTKMVSANQVPAIAGFLSIFTAPVLLLFADSKEVLREARIVHLNKFQHDVKKIYDLYFNE